MGRGSGAGWLHDLVTGLTTHPISSSHRPLCPFPLRPAPLLPIRPKKSLPWDEDAEARHENEQKQYQLGVSNDGGRGCWVLLQSVL